MATKAKAPQVPQSQQVTQTCNKLEKFANDELEPFLSKLDKAHINVFRHLKLERNETLHSKVIASFLNPETNYNLAPIVFKEFLKNLCHYTSSECGSVVNGKTVLTNAEILRSNILCGGINSEQDLINLVPQDNNYIVKTEYVIDDRTNRMDIFIDIPKTETVIVVENKIDTAVHDNQLERYIKEVTLNEPYKSYKHKIFIYLSLKAANGELPKNLGGNKQYNENYCILDYNAINDIVDFMIKNIAVLNTPTNQLTKKGVATTPSKKVQKELIQIMEDYKEIMNLNLSKDNDVRTKCKELYNKYKEELAIITNYYDNLHEVLEYSKDYLRRKGIHIKTTKGTESFEFFTDTLKRFVDNHNGSYIPEKDSFYRCGPDSGNKICVWLLTEKNGKDAENIILNKYPASNCIDTFLTWDERAKAFPDAASVTKLGADGVLTKADVEQKWDQILNKITAIETKL